MPIVREALRTRAEPLDAGTQEAMEHHFGYDLSGVRIHSGPAAAASAEAVGALAFALGPDIVLGRRGYAPHTDAGRGLIAHELAHVAQLAAGTTGPEGVLEAQAEAAEQGILVSVRPDGRSRWAPPRIHRKPDRITGITANLATSSVTVTFDDGTAITGGVTSTNLVPGEYQARWDKPTGEFVITPWPTTERIIEFVVSGSPDFIRRYARLRTEITRPIPLTVVSAPPAEPPGVEPAAAGEGVPHGMVALPAEEALRMCEAGELSGIMTFPFRPAGGIWRLDDAPIAARREGEHIVVSQPSRVRGTDMFRRDTVTLPTDVFIGGIRLLPNQLVRVRLYDEEERVICVPAVAMLEFARASTKAVYFSMGGTVIEVATFFIPAAVITRPLTALVRGGRAATAAAVIGTAEAAPVVAGRVAPAAVATLESRAVAAATEAATVRATTTTVVRAAERAGAAEATAVAGRVTLGTTTPRVLAEAGTRTGAVAAAETGIRAASEAEIEAALETVTAPRATGGARPRIEGRPLPTTRAARLEAEDIPRLAGEALGAAITRINTVIGHEVAEDTAIRAAWDRARNALLSRHTLTPTNARELYEAARRLFWEEVRRDPAAARYFADAGFVFPSGPGTAPMLSGVRAGVPEAEIRLSLDHIDELARGSNWTRALDPTNLRFEFMAPNTFREIVMTRHPMLRGTP